MLYSQNVNGALSRDSSSIYHNNSLDNIIAVNNSSTFTNATLFNKKSIDTIIVDDQNYHSIDDIDDTINNDDDGEIDEDFASRRILTNAQRKRRHQPIYHNEFAVYIPSGNAMADDIAAKHGFTNLGQVSLHFLYFILCLWNVFRSQTSPGYFGF